MLGFLKPKLDIEVYGASFGIVFEKIFWKNAGPDVEAVIEELIRAGARQETVRPEYAVFAAVQARVGMAGAYQLGLLTMEQCVRMQEALQRELHNAAVRLQSSFTPPTAYSSIDQWMNARMTMYSEIVTITEPATANQAIVDYFCDFAFNMIPDPNMKRLIQGHYEIGSASVWNVIARHRVK